MPDRDKERGRPVAYRGGGFDYRPSKLTGVLTFVELVAVWETGSRTGFISNLVLPAPSEVLAAFVQLWRSGELWAHLGASLSRLIMGWTLGTVLGVAFGFAIALFAPVRASLTPLVAAIFPVPKIACRAPMAGRWWTRPAPIRSAPST